MRKKIRLFIILTLVNGLIFLFREYFTYVPTVNYDYLYKKNQNHDLEKWNVFTEYYPPDEIMEARMISRPWFNKSYLTTFDSVLIIADQVYKNLSQQTGQPSSYLETLSPINKYKKLITDSTEKLWCGTYSQIFNFFCIANNIPSRYIEIMNPGDHHVVNEVYLTNSKTWILMDLTCYIMAPKSSNGQLLNLIEFANELRNGNCVFVHPYTEPRICSNHPIVLKYYIPDLENYYHEHINNDKAYNTGNKILRYLLPVSWYHIYPAKQNNNIAFGIKIVLFYLWFSYGLYLFYSYVSNYSIPF